MRLYETSSFPPGETHQDRLDLQQSLFNRFLCKKRKLVILCKKMSEESIVSHTSVSEEKACKGKVNGGIFEETRLRPRTRSKNRKGNSPFPDETVQKLRDKRPRSKDIWSQVHRRVKFSVFPKQRPSSVPVHFLSDDGLKVKEDKAVKIEQPCSSSVIFDMPGLNRFFENDILLSGILVPVSREVLDFDGNFDPEFRSSEAEEESPPRSHKRKVTEHDNFVPDTESYLESSFDEKVVAPRKRFVKCHFGLGNIHCDNK